MTGLVYEKNVFVLKGVNSKCSILSEGFQATLFSSFDQHQLISSTGGRDIGRTDSFFFLSFDPNTYGDRKGPQLSLPP